MPRRALSRVSAGGLGRKPACCASPARSLESPKVRENDPSYPIDLRVFHDLGRSGAPRADSVLKGLDGDIQAYLVPELEAVRHGFCDTEHMHLYSVEFVLFSALPERRPRHAVDADWRIVEPRLPLFGPYGDADAGRYLGSDPMEIERAHKAEHGGGRSRCHYGDVVLAEPGQLRRPIHTACHPFNEPCVSHPVQSGVVDARLCGLGGPHDAAPFSEYAGGRLHCLL